LEDSPQELPAAANTAAGPAGGGQRRRQELLPDFPPELSAADAAVWLGGQQPRHGQLSLQKSGQQMYHFFII
jgi:hypothetical protein